MKRIIIIGSGGAGKSTLARQLGEILNLEVIHLDKLYWLPNWKKPPKDEWEKEVAEMLKKDNWIIDGNFNGTMEMRLEACETAIFLDFPCTICLYRVFKRWLTYRNTNRPDMTVGCNEKIDFEMAHWVWNFPKKNAPKIEARLKKFEKDKNIIRLKSPKEVEDFLQKLSSPKQKRAAFAPLLAGLK